MPTSEGISKTAKEADVVEPWTQYCPTIGWNSSYPRGGVALNRLYCKTAKSKKEKAG
jgi:hypothetical protein